MECAGKVKNALCLGDSLALRRGARCQAELAPSLLWPLNPPVRAQTPSHALRLALDFPVAPPGYRTDMLICLGIDTVGHTDAEVATASARLARGALGLMRAVGGTTVPEPDLREALLAGMLERYLSQ